VILEFLTVVAQHDDDGILIQLLPLQPTEERRDLVIVERDLPVVERDLRAESAPLLALQNSGGEARIVGRRRPVGIMGIPGVDVEEERG
jgi:hypothetical protein